MQIAINGDITKKGMMLLRDFIKDITVTRRNKTAMQQFVDLATKGYLIYSVDTISSTNIIDVWIKYRNLLIAWLDTFTKEYEISVPFDDLPIDYQARISLLTLLLLARDLTEAHDYVFDGENREIVNTPVISGTNVTLYDVVRFMYPVALWSGEPNDILSIASILTSNTKELLNRGGKWNVILYTPLLASGIMTEDFIHEHANYIAGKHTKEPRFTVTGLGQAFMKYAAFVPRHSLSTSYYYTALMTFTAISHVHHAVLSSIINDVLRTDIYGNIDYMLLEYSNYARHINALNGHPDFYAQAYTRGDALRDLAAMTFTLINARLELLNKDQELHERLLSKYTFLMEAPSELVRDAVRAILLVSGSIAR
jgi:hypothetical protein